MIAGDVIASFRGRFAPSPTGRMHLGNARSALLGWLQARCAGGEFLLRIEDLDAGRSRPELVETLMEDLRYLGLDWDGPVVFQSQRTEAYDAALATLRQAGLLYPCFCSRAEIARAASAPHGPSDEGPRYPGTCSQLSEVEQRARAKERRPALRFRAPEGVVSFEDVVQGRQGHDIFATVGDFVVQKNDGVASYQLAVVVDDAWSGITDVLRADDLLSSTPRQLSLYRALGLRVPRFAHVPLLLGSDGRRLAKREGAFALADLRVRGVPAERVVSLLGQLSGVIPPGTGDVAARELVSSFSLEQVPKTPVVVHEEGLLHDLGL